MPFGVSSGIPNVIIHAKFHVDRLRGFWAAEPPKVPFPILIGTTLTTVLHYRADCDHTVATVCVIAGIIEKNCTIQAFRSKTEGVFIYFMHRIVTVKTVQDG